MTLEKDNTRNGGKTSASQRDPANSPAGCERIVIIGKTGSGKTTPGREIAVALGVPQVELDSLTGEDKKDSSKSYSQLQK